MSMSLYPAGTFSGQYEVRGDRQSADYLALHEFGLAADGTAGRVNTKLAIFALGVVHEQPELPVVAGSLLTDEINRLAEQVKMTVQFTETLNVKASTVPGAGSGTWGEVLEERRIARDNDLRNPIRVAQANHIGRTVVQANKAGLSSIVLPGLPALFDKDSRQFQTRNAWAWAGYTLLANPASWILRQL